MMSWVRPLAKALSSWFLSAAKKVYSFQYTEGAERVPHNITFLEGWTNLNLAKSFLDGETVLYAIFKLLQPSHAIEFLNLYTLRHWHQTPTSTSEAYYSTPTPFLQPRCFIEVGLAGAIRRVHKDRPLYICEVTYKLTEIRYQYVVEVLDFSLYQMALKLRQILTWLRLIKEPCDPSERQSITSTIRGCLYTPRKRINNFQSNPRIGNYIRSYELQVK